MVKKLSNNIFTEALTKLECKNISDRIYRVDFIESQIKKGYITESEAKRIWQKMFKGTWKETVFEGSD